MSCPCVQAVAGKADYKVQWGTLHEKKYLPLKKRHAALEMCANHSWRSSCSSSERALRCGPYHPQMLASCLRSTPLSLYLIVATVRGVR